MKIRSYLSSIHFFNLYYNNNNNNTNNHSAVDDNIHTASSSIPRRHERRPAALTFHFVSRTPDNLQRHHRRRALGHAPTPDEEKTTMKVKRFLAARLGFNVVPN